MSVQDVDPAELPAVTHESVRNRILLESLLAVLSPKLGARLVMEMNERMAELDTTDVRRIRSAAFDGDIRRHRLGARALWNAQLPRFVTMLRKRKYRELLKR